MSLPRNRKSNEMADDEPVELAALADGSLAPDRRDALLARVAASPTLAAQLAVQERAVELARSAAAEVEAPAALRAKVGARRRERRAPVRGRLVLAGAVATAAAAAAVVLVVTVTGTPGTQFKAALAPTALAAGATGQATLTKTASGWRINLHATGLPRLDSGRFYEAWLRNADGVLVPVGTFNEGRKVTLWSGASPEQGFTTLTVTRERADGNQASSGEKVLVGTAEER
jgi:hypothetical protein